MQIGSAETDECDVPALGHRLVKLYDPLTRLHSPVADYHADALTTGPIHIRPIGPFSPQQVNEYSAGYPIIDFLGSKPMQHACTRRWKRVSAAARRRAEQRAERGGRRTTDAINQPIGNYFECARAPYRACLTNWSIVADTLELSVRGKRSI